jgi:hypothetical protein
VSIDGKSTLVRHQHGVIRHMNLRNFAFFFIFNLVCDPRFTRLPCAAQGLSLARMRELMLGGTSSAVQVAIGVLASARLFDSTFSSHH